MQCYKIIIVIIKWENMDVAVTCLIVLLSGAEIKHRETFIRQSPASERTESGSLNTKHNPKTCRDKIHLNCEGHCKTVRGTAKL
jgi:hypothetical protein